MRALLLILLTLFSFHDSFAVAVPLASGVEPIVPMAGETPVSQRDKAETVCAPVPSNTRIVDVGELPICRE